ncbi:MAG TPA: hypothetical protein VNU20_10560 [Candidatus Sulfotelmatobacter sp.]|jgi:hypothetical protein|nr:hypothetical protein [Candidatus Sulfotelmatobacter sp.]
MKSLSRFLILAGFFLVATTTLPAQRFISSGFSSGYLGGYSGYGGYGGYGDYSYGWGSDFGGCCFGGFSLHHPEEHAPFGVGYAHGDSDFQQSEFMDFDQAVALGKKILAEQAAPKPSLGDIVRSMHLHPSVPPAKSGNLVLFQDNQGKLSVCRTSDTNCRSTA